MTTPSLEEQTDLLILLKWADEISARKDIRAVPKGWPTRGLQVWANADYPKDARRARSYGAVASVFAGPSTCSSNPSACPSSNG